MVRDHSDRTTNLDVDRAQWLAQILANSPDVISIIDTDGKMLYVSWTAPSTTADKVIGKYAQDFLPDGHRATWMDAFNRAITTGEPQNVTVRSVRDYWWQTRLAPIRHEGRVTYILSIGTNITARKNAEEALALKDQQLRLAVDAAGMGQWSLNTTTDRCTCDEVTRRMFAFPEAPDLTSKEFFERVHPQDQDLVRTHVQGAIASGQQYAVQCRIVAPDGRERWVLLMGKAVHEAPGETADIIGGVIDITRQKDSEAQQRRAQKLEAIGQLAGGVAHDFNNLLVAIMGNMQLAQRASTPERQRGYVDDALEASQRAADLTRQLLAFARRQQIQMTPLAVHGLLADTVKLLQRLLPESIEIALLCAPGAPHVLGDRGQIEQVITNLCINARDAMPRGGRLVLQTALVEPDATLSERHTSVRAGRYVVISVSDTGVGIPPHVLDRVFDPFFTTKEQGTGLGLATAYGIVEQHGGFLQVDSELDRGTTFRVYLPVAAADAREVPARRPPPALGGTETVLVAEDEPLVRAVVVRFLIDAGYRVLEAEDGARAIELFAAEPDTVKLVLLDSVMPRKSGSEAAAAIRELRPQIPVIVTSGYSNALASGGAAGVTLVPKPYEPDTLLRAIREALDRSKETTVR